MPECPLIAAVEKLPDTIRVVDRAIVLLVRRRGLRIERLATFRRKITGFELAVNGAGKKVARLVGRATF